MYDIIEDPYCYPQTSVLRNLYDHTDPDALAVIETMMAAERAEEGLPSGEMDVAHYKGIHQHLFQDIYSWAGEFRTVRISKGASAFCYPEYIEAQMTELFHELRDKDFFRDLPAERFVAESTAFLSRLNAIHPFRDGNGRTQNLFLHLLAVRADHSFDFDKLRSKAFLAAMVSSFEGDDSGLEAYLLKLLS